MLQTQLFWSSFNLRLFPDQNTNILRPFTSVQDLYCINLILYVRSFNQSKISASPKVCDIGGGKEEHGSDCFSCALRI